MEGKISLDDTSIQASQGGKKDFKNNPIRRISMKTGQKLRVTFTSDEVVQRNRHYVKGVGYRRCLAYQGFCPACLAADKNSQFYTKDFKGASAAFGANVFVYNTNESCTELNKDKVGDVHLFVFGNEKFAALREIKQMYGSLVGLDLLITCTDEGFQKMTITPFPEKVAFLNDPQVKSYVEKAFANDSYPLEKMIAKEVNPAQMVKDFNLNPAILELPQAKYFVDMAANQAASPAVQQAPVNPATQQTTVTYSANQGSESSMRHESTRVIDTNSLLDEL